MLDQLRKLMALRQTQGAYDPTSQEQIEPGPGVPNQRNPYPLIDEQVQAGAELSPIAKGLDKLGALRATKEAVGRVPILRELAGGMLEPATQMAEIPNVFHGSPYRFDKFDLGKVGTGEGAQAFGHGLYFTSKKGIAEHYKAAGLLHDKGVKIGDRVVLSKGTVGNNATVEDYAVDALARFDGDKQKALNWLNNNPGPRDLEAMEWVNRNITGEKAELVKAGNTYTSTLMPGKKPEDYTFMDWHEPVGKSQMDAAINALRNKKDLGYPGQEYLRDWTSGRNLPKTGQELYQNLSHEMGTAQASSLLKQNGIDGIRYPTETLSGKQKGGGGWNYVVFDDKDIKITGVE